MKRFLILFSLVAFMAVSCAGPNKVGWRKLGSDFRQDKFEKDRKWCIQIIDQDLHSEAFGQALDECLAWEGYKYEPVGSVSSKRVQKKKGGWEKLDFSHVQFEKDQEECEQILSNDIEHPVTVAECLAKKGYEFEPPPADKKEPNKVLTVVLFSAALAIAVGIMVASGGRASPVLWSAGMSPPKN